MRKILIIEDDLNSLEGLIALFQQERYLVYGAQQAREALQIAAALEFDMVLADYHLPDFDGIDLIAELKRKNPFLLCFLFTALISNRLEQRVFQAGIRKIFKKPLDIPGLLDAVAEPLPSGYLVRTDRTFRHAAPLWKN